MPDSDILHAYTLETSHGPDVLKAYIAVFGVVEPQETQGEDGILTEIEPLTPSCIALEMGRGFANLGVDPVFANVFVSPNILRPHLVAIHEIWRNMSRSDKATLRLLSPSLHLAITTMIDYGGGEVNVSDGDPEDSQPAPAAVKEDTAPVQEDKYHGKTRPEAYWYDENVE